jgi:hypothetical protein
LLPTLASCLLPTRKVAFHPEFNPSRNRRLREVRDIDNFMKTAGDLARQPLLDAMLRGLGLIWF